MKRPVSPHPVRLVSHAPPYGYTLVEILVATVLTLIMMGVVVAMFGRVGDSVSDSRATLELSDRLRATAARLQMDQVEQSFFWRGDERFLTSAQVGQPIAA